MMIPNLIFIWVNRNKDRDNGSLRLSSSLRRYSPSIALACLIILPMVQSILTKRTRSERFLKSAKGSFSASRYLLNWILQSQYFVFHGLVPPRWWCVLVPSVGFPCILHLGPFLEACHEVSSNSLLCALTSYNNCTKDCLYGKISGHRSSQLQQSFFPWWSSLQNPLGLEFGISNTMVLLPSSAGKSEKTSLNDGSVSFPRIWTQTWSNSTLNPARNSNILSLSTY